MGVGVLHAHRLSPGRPQICAPAHRQSIAPDNRFFRTEARDQRRCVEHPREPPIGEPDERSPDEGGDHGPDANPLNDVPAENGAPEPRPREIPECPGAEERQRQHRGDKEARKVVDQLDAVERFAVHGRNLLHHEFIRLGRKICVHEAHDREDDDALADGEPQTPTGNAPDGQKPDEKQHEVEEIPVNHRREERQQILRAEAPRHGNQQQNQEPLKQILRHPERQKRKIRRQFRKEKIHGCHHHGIPEVAFRDTGDAHRHEKDAERPYPLGGKMQFLFHRLPPIWPFARKKAPFSV